MRKLKKNYLKNLLRQICENNQLTFNYNKYDWILKKNAEVNNEEHKESSKMKEEKDKDKEKEKDKDKEKEKDKEKDKDNDSGK